MLEVALADHRLNLAGAAIADVQFCWRDVVVLALQDLCLLPLPPLLLDPLPPVLPLLEQLPLLLTLLLEGPAAAKDFQDVGGRLVIQINDAIHSQHFLCILLDKLLDLFTSNGCVARKLQESARSKMSWIVDASIASAVARPTQAALWLLV